MLKTFAEVIKGFTVVDDIEELEDLGAEITEEETDDFWEEGMGGWMSFRVYKKDDIKYIAIRNGWVFRNP